MHKKLLLICFVHLSLPAMYQEEKMLTQFKRDMYQSVVPSMQEIKKIEQQERIARYLAHKQAHGNNKKESLCSVLTQLICFLCCKNKND